MKTKVLSYSLIFTALLALFLYVNNANIYEYQSKQINTKSVKIEKLQDSILQLLETNAKATYFSLSKNQRAAQQYSYSATEVESSIQNALNELAQSNQWNQSFSFPSNPNNWITNTFSILNHQWLIVEVSDGNQWGELLLDYTMVSETAVTFELISSLFYQTN